MTQARSPRWQQVIWTGAGFGLLLTIIILLAFAGSTVARVMDVISQRHDADLAFVFASVGVVTLTLLRLLAILIGAAIAFAGLAVSFFAHANSTSLTGELPVQPTTSAKVELATYAPGIVGLFVGALIIVCALFARSKHDYRGPETYSVVLPPALPASGVNRPAPAGSGLRPLEDFLKVPASPASK